MLLLDTHVWVGWMDTSPRLAPHHAQAIRDNAAAGLGVSVISCWEVALLVAKGRSVYASRSWTGWRTR